LDDASPPTAKVADFGLSRYLGGDGLLSPRLSQVGTPLWSAPEVRERLAGGRAAYTLSCDVYSFAIFLLELEDFTLVHRSMACSQCICQWMASGWRPSPIELRGMRLLWLVQGCWAQVAADRPSFAEVVSLLTEGRETAPPAAELAFASSNGSEAESGSPQQRPTAGHGCCCPCCSASPACSADGSSLYSGSGSDCCMSTGREEGCLQQWQPWHAQPRNCCGGCAGPSIPHTCPTTAFRAFAPPAGESDSGLGTAPTAMPAWRPDASCRPRLPLTDAPGAGCSPSRAAGHAPSRLGPVVGMAQRRSAAREGETRGQGRGHGGGAGGDEGGGPSCSLSATARYAATPPRSMAEFVEWLSTVMDETAVHEATQKLLPLLRPSASDDGSAKNLLPTYPRDDLVPAVVEQLKLSAQGGRGAQPLSPVMIEVLRQVRAMEVEWFPRRCAPH